MPFETLYQKGTLTQSDYLSRHALHTEKEVTNSEDDLSNLLYTLHATSVTDCIGLLNIAKETDKDPILSVIKRYILANQTWIPKSASAKVTKFRHIMDKVSISGNGIMHKGDRIILSESLQNNVIQIADAGAHFGESGIERRLHSHFSSATATVVQHLLIRKQRSL